MAKLRLSLTIPGAVSLGAYEGGALAALLIAARELGEDTLLIDSVAAASAGSITGLLAARALLRGADPIELFTEAWVTRASIAALRGRTPAAPLSSEALTSIATSVLGPGGPPDGPPAARQGQPVRISMALTNLAGLTLGASALAAATPFTTSTFFDWSNFEITGDAGPDDYVRYAASAIASGSNALGFPAKQLDRRAERSQYERENVEGFPPDGLFWFTDGGTVDNEPLGRTIGLAEAIGSDDSRLYLLVHPNPAWPSPAPENMWEGKTPCPPWVRTGTHAMGIGRAQSIAADLRRLQAINERLDAVDEVVATVEGGLAEGAEQAGLSAAQSAQLGERLGAALGGPPGGADWASALRARLQAASGLAGKRPAQVEVVSPLVDPEVQEAPASQLAGAFLFYFGGFFDVRFRQSDFALGYRNMAYWLAHDLPRHLDGVDVAAATHEVARRYHQLGWDGIRHGGAQLGSLTWRERWHLVRLGLHSARVVAHDVLHGGV